MRQRLSFAGLAALAFGSAASAQTHAVKKPETVVRAVAVYEWTGDEAKPTASRLVPVSIFIDNEMRDAGVYLARPVPFALDRGTIFECEKAGQPEGLVELAYQRHLLGTDATPFDDGWLGYGDVQARCEGARAGGREEARPAAAGGDQRRKQAAFFRIRF